MNLDDAHDEVRRLSRLLDRGLEFLREQAAECAEAEAEYRKARSVAWVTNPEGTAKEREDKVNAATADLRKRRDTAENLKQAALESVRSRRQQISLYQSLLAAHRSEAEFVRTGPAWDDAA